MLRKLICAMHPHSRLGGALLLCMMLVPCSSCGAGSARLPPAPASAPLALGAPEPARLVAGTEHACAIQSERVLCWGNPQRRALGETVMRGHERPLGPFWVRDVGQPLELAAGDSFTCALASTGSVVCWGRLPDALSLGRGGWTGGLEALREEAERTRRVVIDHWQDVVDLDARGNGMCAVHRDGTISCAGAGVGGVEFGSPPDAEGRIERRGDAQSVAVGGRHVCILKRDGRVACAGPYGFDGAEEEDRREPPRAREVAGLSDIVQIASGDAFACALDRAGAVSCWGRSIPRGETSSATTTPVPIEGASPARAIVAGTAHACALGRDGRVRCWGDGWYGQLGDGTTLDRRGAVEVAGISGVVELTAGSEFSCARHAGGISCWGRNDVGQLGMGELPPPIFLTTVEDVSDAIDIDVGGGHACAVASDGRVACWGNDNFGQLGDGPGAPASRTPLWVEGLSDVVDVELGSLSSCARTSDGTVYCWGRWLGGELLVHLERDAQRVPDRPSRAEELAGAQALALEGSYGCAIEADGQVMCWGLNGDGEIDVVRAPGIVTPAVALAVGDRATCAVGADGILHRWEDSHLTYSVPTTLGGEAARFVDVGCGFRTCGVTDRRELACWDHDGTPLTELALTDVRSLRCGGDSCCAITGASLQCWGGVGLSTEDYYARIRNESVLVPFELPARDPVAFGVGRDFVCWAERGGPVRCLGIDNRVGTLGGATPDFSTRPVTVGSPVEPPERSQSSAL